MIVADRVARADFGATEVRAYRWVLSSRGRNSPPREWRVAPRIADFKEVDGCY